VTGLSVPETNRVLGRFAQFRVLAIAAHRAV
jgi:hypothetical protein